MKRVRARALVASVAVVVLSLVAAASASAFTLTNVAVTPSTTAAGAHPDFTVDMQFDDTGNGAADSVKDYDIHFAPGIVSYINHVGRCSAADFALADTSNASNCPADSHVGDVDTQAVLQVSAFPPVNAPLTLPTGAIYNIEPPPGYPAALGIDTPPAAPGLPRVKILVTVTIDPHDLALTATIHDLPNSSNGLSVHINRITQTLFGMVSGKSFFTNPTACIPAPVVITAHSHAGATSSASDAYTPTDCAHVPFDTSLTVSADPPITDSPSTISFDVKPGLADVPRVNSHVKSATVVAPPGVLINPALAARLDACTDAQFQQSDTSVEAACPPSSAVGDISFVSPILGAFPGKAYFGTQTPTDRLRLFLDVPLYGAHIKVSAHVHPDYQTGQITTVFDQLPQIAFTDFALTFHGGPRSALVTPTTCGEHVATAVVEPWSGGAASTPSASFTTSFDGQGGACQRIFQPTVSASLGNPKAGGSGPFSLVVVRPDRNVPIGKMTFHLPAGLVGNLALSGLTRCSLTDANAGHCPASSHIGSVQAVAGSGTEPPTLPGDAYLTEPLVSGDPAGLSVIVPAKLGPVDAGTVVVDSRLVLRGDGGLDVISNDIPALQLGIPLALRQLTVAIDRQGFMRNPTSCGDRPLGAHFDAIGGGSADVAASVNVTDCGALPFAPKIHATLGAKGADGAGKHPPLRIDVTQAAGEAAIRTTHVALPSSLSTNLKAVQAACAPDALAAGTCPAAARIATATALSPLVPAALTGPVYLVAREPGKLPKIVVQLRGAVSVDLEAFVNIGKRGRVGTTFPVVPDLPISRFTLRFHGGRTGALTNAKSLCAKVKPKRRPRLAASFTGHNGKALKARPLIAVKGCKRRHRHHRRHHR